MWNPQDSNQARRDTVNLPRDRDGCVTRILAIPAQRRWNRLIIASPPFMENITELYILGATSKSDKHTFFETVAWLQRVLKHLIRYSKSIKEILHPKSVEAQNILPKNTVLLRIFIQRGYYFSGTQFSIFSIFFSLKHQWILENSHFLRVAYITILVHIAYR